MKKLLYFFLILFFLLNIITCNHTYNLTHFSTEKSLKRITINDFSTFDKVKAVFLGVALPKRKNGPKPDATYQSVKIKSDLELDAWHHQKDGSKGTVLLFHGYAASKSSLLGQEKVFHELGYSTLLVDFRGAGDSEGHYTTIGYLEAKDVKAGFDYIQKQGEQNIFIYGVSMGAASVLKAMQDYELPAKAIIIECPFANMRQAIANRFSAFNLPTFLLTDLMVLHGSVQQGVNIYNHAPSEYAKGVKVPTLLMYGERDERVLRSEIDAVYGNLKEPKKLVTWPKSGHESYLNDYAVEWKEEVDVFFGKYVDKVKQEFVY